MELFKGPLHFQKAFVPHANAVLTPRAHLRLAHLIVDDGWLLSVGAKIFMVSTVAARKWPARLGAEGVSGMQDRSSRPRSMPTKAPLPVVKARWRRRLGPVQIAGELGLAPLTVPHGTGALPDQPSNRACQTVC